MVAICAFVAVALTIGAVVVFSGGDDTQTVSRTLERSTTTERADDDRRTSTTERSKRTTTTEVGAGEALAVGEVTIVGDPLPEPPNPGEPDQSIGISVPGLVGTNPAREPSVVPVKNTPTLLVFAAHWCPHCNDELPVIVDWMKGGGADGVEVVIVLTAIDQDRPNYPPAEWLDGFNFTGPVLIDDADSSAATAYGLTGFPMLVAISADGLMVDRVSGEQPTEVLDALAAAARS